MVISEKKDADFESFKSLVNDSRERLSREADDKPLYYKKRSGQKLEEDVSRVMSEAAVGTEFEDKIKLISGHSFPDIVAIVNENRNFGVEVKSTKKDHWQTLGNSVLESLRYQNMDRIYLMFGKLGGKVEFKARPYEECLSSVSVTHSPRYHIDMELKRGKTIFDMIKQPYDDVRKMSNPIEPFINYYRSQLKPGESLWWIDNNVEEKESCVKLRLWNTLTRLQRDDILAKAIILFPEIITRKAGKKYERYALWLVSEYAIVVPNARDEFSASGQKDIIIGEKTYHKVPRLFEKIYSLREKIIKEFYEISEAELNSYWPSKKVLVEKRISRWIEIIDNELNQNNSQKYNFSVKDLLEDILLN